MNNNPLISVIIPCYNHAGTLKDTLQSVLASDFNDWEAIIINDGSTDNSDSVGKGCEALDPRIRYMHQENAGPAVARNNAISNSTGKYILPLDADDLIHPSYIRKAVEYLEEHEDCAIFYCRAEFFGGKQGAFNAYWTSYKDILIENSIFSSCIYRRKDFDRIGGYDETFRTSYEDWEFNIRLLYGNDVVYQDDEVMFYYRKNNDNKSGRDDKAATARDKVKNLITIKHAEKYVQYFGNYPFIVKNSQAKEIKRNKRKLKTRLRSIRILIALLAISVSINIIALTILLLNI